MSNHTQIAASKPSGHKFGDLRTVNGVILTDSGQPLTKKEALERLDFDVIHPKAVKIVARMMNALTPNGGCDIVLLVAPPGAGKSHVAKAVHRKVYAQFSSSDSWTEDMVPSMLIDIGQDGQHNFDFKDIHLEICAAGNAPPIPHRAPRPLPYAEVDPGRGRPARLRKASTRVINDRKTRIVMLDEAAHVLNVKSQQTLKRHAQALKTLANGSSAVFALVCAYDGIPLLAIDSQLRRRIKLIHLERYRDDDKDEKTDYSSVVLTIANQLGLDLSEVVGRISVLMERTVGCVGATFDVFRNAITDGWANGVFNYDELDNNLPSSGYAATVREEALAAEILLKEL